MSERQLGAGTVFEVKCRLAIDAIAVVYRADRRAGAIERNLALDHLRGLLIAQPIRAAYAAALPAPGAASAPSESITRFGSLPYHVFRIASRTSEPTPGE